MTVGELGADMAAAVRSTSEDHNAVDLALGSQQQMIASSGAGAI